MEIEKTKKIKHQFPSAREWDRAMDVWKIYGQNVGNYSSPRMDAGYWETNTTIFHWYSFDTNKKSHVSSPLPPLPSVFCWYLFLFGCQQKKHIWSKVPNTSPGCSTHYSSPSFRQRSTPPRQPRCLLGWGHRLPGICTSSPCLPLSGETCCFRNSWRPGIMFLKDPGMS